MDSKSVKKLDKGQVAEKVVAHWLEAKGWTILYQRWHCRWGEIDLIAKTPKAQSEILVFVEVKARSMRNWDLNGLLAVTPQKQTKLLQSAEIFLAEHPEWSCCPCRFDVALVQMLKGQIKKTEMMGTSNSVSVESTPSIRYGQHYLRVCQYIESAFC